ncbi:MAG: aldehyde dehydrogenase family protein, partial [Methylophilaceae bacterium]
HENIVEDIAKRLADGAATLNVGDPTLPETEVGPLILPREVDRVHEWVSEAVACGATLLTGGKKLSDTTYAPTILLNPPQDSKVSTMEIFGPVICVYSYSNHQETIELANSLDVAFQAAVYTQDLAFANDCIKRLDATAVMVNDHTAFRVDWMPFAGRRASGYGVGGIGYTMHDMVQIKMAVINEN